MGQEEVGERVERTVHVAEGHEERRGLVAHAGEIDLGAMRVQGASGIEAEAHDLLRDDADDAGVHLFRAHRGAVAQVRRGTEARRVAGDCLVEQGEGAAVSQGIHQPNNRFEGLLGGGQLFDGVGDKARQQVGRRSVPEGLGKVLRGADRRCDREDVLL